MDTAAATAGSTVEGRAAKKVAKHALRETGGYDFTPLVVKSYGRQCSRTPALLNLLGHLAADSGRVAKVGVGLGHAMATERRPLQGERLPVLGQSACLLPSCR